MTINSRSKGCVGERELRDELRKLFPHLEEEIIRGQQYSGRGEDDVVGLPGIHIECKRVEKLQLYPAVEQSELDSNPQEVPVVCHRRNRKPWLLTMQLEDLPKFVQTVNGLLQPKNPTHD